MKGRFREEGKGRKDFVEEEEQNYGNSLKEGA
jgi:hypothetical protein